MYKYIFSIGNSRSGTTLLSKVIGRFPDTCTLDEVHFFERYFTADDFELKVDRDRAIEILSSLFKTQGMGYLHSGTDEADLKKAESVIPQDQSYFLVSNLYRKFLDIQIEVNSVSSICEQTPRNQFYIHEINRILGAENCKFIYIYRNPLDVIASQKNKWKLKKLGASSKIPVSESIRAWSNYMPLINILIWRSGIRNFLKNKDQVYPVRYESLIQNPNEVIQDVCKEIGVKYDKKFLNVGIYSSSHSAASNNKQGIVRIDKPDITTVLNHGEIWLISTICKKEIIALDYNYECTFSYKVFFSLLFIIFQTMAKAIVSFTLNYSKYKNPFKTIYQRLK